MSTVSFDATSTKTRIINRLRAKNQWQDILNTSAVSALIDPFAEEIQYLASYDTYLTRENKWNLARNKTSLLAFSGIHKYNAHRQISAQGTLKLSADETFNDKPTKNIQIPKYTQFSTDNNIKFVAKDDYVITTADNYIEIDAIQGVLRTYNYVGLGQDFEEISIDDTTIENTFFELYVNGTKWTSVTNIFEYEATDTVYELTNKIDFTGIYIKFGNDINGKKIQSGDTIEFKYIQTDGEDGDINTANNITTIDSTIFDIDGSVVDIYVKNEDSLLGGQYFETLEEIRKNAPDFFQTGDRASNNEDYRQIVLNNFSYIIKLVVWGVYENNIDDGVNPWTYTSLDDNNVYISAIRTDLSESLSTSQKLEISQKLNEYKAPTDIVQFTDAVIVPLVFTIAAYVSDKSYTLSEVKSNIDSDLTNEYYISNNEFFEAIRFSDYQRLIDESSGVDYHHTTIQLYEDYSFNNSWNVTLSLPIYTVKTSSVKVYVKDIINDTAEVQIGEDDGSGNITGVGIYSLTGSQINYTTGVGSVLLDNVPPVLTEPYTYYRVRVFYQIVDDDLVLKERNHIFNYDSSLTLPLITVTYTS